MLGRPREAGIGERDADPRASGLGQRRGEADEGGALGPGEAVVLPRVLDRRHRPAGDRLVAEIADQHLLVVMSERVQPLLPLLRLGRNRSLGEDGRLPLVPGQGEADLEESLDLALLRGTDLESVGHCDLDIGRNLLDAGRMLNAETDSEPGVDERLVSRYEDVVPRASLLDPVLGCGRVQVARVLGLLDRVPCDLDPDVRSPGVVARRAQQVSDDAAVPESDSSGGAVAGPEGLDLGAKVGLLAQQRLQRAVSPMAGFQKPGGIAEVAF